MAITKLPTPSVLGVCTFETPTAPNPRLSAGISASTSDTTLRFSNPPLDKDGNVVTFGFILGVTNKNGYTERIYVPAGALSTDGLTATGVTRGLNPTGSDYTTGSADFVAQHEGGSSVFCVVDTTYYYMMLEAMQGDIATGGSELIVGAGANEDMYFSVQDASGTQQVFRRQASTGNAQYSDDGGSSWNDIAGALAGQLVVVSGTDTTAGNLQAKAVAGDGIDATVLNPAGNESLEFAVDVTDIIDTAAGLEEDGSNNIQVKLEADKGLEFSGTGGVQVKAGSGIAVGASGVSVSGISKSAGVAYEALSEGDAVCKLPVEVQWYQALDDTNSIALGDDNTRRRYAVKFTATEAKTITDRNVRLKKTGSATQTITVSLQADSSGEPSGTALVSDTLAASTLTTSFATYNFDFGAGQAVVKGTDYWVVIELDATDASNYVDVQVASAWDDYFVTAERLTFDLDAGTWGGSVTNAPFWCWGDETFGYGVVKTNGGILSKVWSFEGFVDAAASAGDDVSINFEISDVVQGVTLEEGQIYYLKGTAGQITTSGGVDFNVSGSWSFDPAYGYAVPSARYAVARGVLDSNGDVVAKIERGQKFIRCLINMGIHPSATTTIRGLITWLGPCDISVVHDSASTFGYMSSSGDEMEIDTTGGYNSTRILPGLSLDAISLAGVTFDVSYTGNEYGVFTINA